jgi:type VI secretion system secreted protein Hcp
MTRSVFLTRTRWLALAVVAALVALAALEAAGPRLTPTNAHAAVGGVLISMKVTGRRTGEFRGDDTTGRRATSGGFITVLSYEYEVVESTSAATGLGTGSRLHKPVTVTHQMGGSSPQFLNSEATNETLAVLIDFSRIDTSGKETIFYKVTLTDALVTDVRQFTSGDVVDEQISFTFRKIQQDDLVAKTSFLDDWQSAA